LKNQKKASVIQGGKYFGFISKSVALEAYRTKLKSMTIE
jgi:CIC family chloride channel protein